MGRKESSRRDASSSRREKRKQEQRQFHPALETLEARMLLDAYGLPRPSLDDVATSLLSTQPEDEENRASVDNLQGFADTLRQRWSSMARDLADDRFESRRDAILRREPRDRIARRTLTIGAVEDVGAIDRRTALGQR